MANKNKLAGVAPANRNEFARAAPANTNKYAQVVPVVPSQNFTNSLICTNDDLPLVGVPIEMRALPLGMA